jgi:hypothetical protein
MEHSNDLLVGLVDGFDQDECGRKPDEGEEVPLGLLAT